MAKGTPMGVWRGKKGSNVFYYLRNSKNAQKQGIRERVYEISNPQTNGQTDQRMKMLPLQRLGATLGTIVRRSWEGVEYGGKTWQKFLSANMGRNATLPYVDKDDDRTIPGDIQISKGSLDGVTLTIEDFDMMNTSLTFTEPSSVNWGTISQGLINENALQAGDQLTIVRCVSTAQANEDALDARYQWSINSLVVDTASTISQADLLQMGIRYTATEGNAELALVVTGSTYHSIVAGAIIVSRLGDSGKYLRSTTRITINETFLADWFSSVRHSAARRSYKRTMGALSTDWPVDPEGGISNSVPGSYTISGLTGTKASCNGKSCWVRRDEETNELVAVYITEWLGEPSTALVNRTNGQAIAYEGTGGTETPLLIADVTALANLPQIQWDGQPTS